METTDNDTSSRVEYFDDALDFFSNRHANTQASLLLPYLGPGLSLLDRGCSPGSITMDLAEFVLPGDVVGMDIAPLQIGRTNNLCEARNLENIRLEIGDVMDLDFPEESSDVALTHGVVEYLEDPVQSSWTNGAHYVTRTRRENQVGRCCGAAPRKSPSAPLRGCQAERGTSPWPRTPGQAAGSC